MNLLLFVIGLLGCSARDTLNRIERAEVEAVLERQREAWNRGDLAGYMEGYARTARLVFTSGGKVRRGWDETLAAYEKRYAGGGRAEMGQLGFEILDAQPVGEGGAVVLGRWRLRDTPHAGSGVFSVVMEHRPEGWRIVHDHTTADPTPPAP
jgi:ketosteroid isomerase-like protein